MEIQPYLFFDGRCEEAIEFYRDALGAELEMLMRFDESPDPIPPGMIPDGAGSKVMHASLRIGGAPIMASDGRCGGNPQFQGISLSLSAPDTAAAQRMFDALARDGQIQMPIGKTFWSPCFGMVRDRFGVAWMVTVAAA